MKPGNGFRYFVAEAFKTPNQNFTFLSGEAFIGA